MKRIPKVVLIFLFAFIVILQPSSAETINCKDSFAPRFLCEYYADVTNNFTFSSIIAFFIAFLIAALVLFILFQIARAVFSWINKSNDDKSRGAAIKSISNAVVGIVLVIILLGVTFVLSNLFTVDDVPNPLYACYPSNVFYPGDLDGSTLNLKPGITKQELPGADVFERKSSTAAFQTGTQVLLDSVNETGKIFNRSGESFNIDDAAFLNTKLYCKDRNTGKEHLTGYVILKRVSIKK